MLRHTSTVSPLPGHHPLWWALTSVVGLTDHQVMRRARISRSVVRRAVTGRSIDPQSLRRLAALLDWGRQEMSRDVPSRRDVPPPLRAYRQAVFALLRDVYDEFSRPPPPADEVPPTLRETDLSAALRRALAAPRRRDLVVGDLRHAHSTTAIRRVARRLRVVESLDLMDRVVWSLPISTDAPPPRFAAPTPTRVQPTGPRQRAAHDAVSMYLGRTPDGSAPAQEVVAALALRGHAPSMVQRAAREMDILRTTTGFGPDKRTVWSLRPLRPEPVEQLSPEDE